MNPPKVRVETVVGDAAYRDPANELRVSVEARSGLTHPWRKFPAFMAEVVTSAVRWAGLFSMAMSFAAGFFAVTKGHVQSALACVCLGVVSVVCFRSEKWLSHRRRQWRDERRSHHEVVLTIGRDTLRFDDVTLQKGRIANVRVERQQAAAPPSRYSRVEVRFNLVLDVEGAKSITALQALEKDDVETVLAAFAECGLEVDEIAL